MEVDFIVGDTTNAALDISLSRIIAGGFEISNDTAELYKDGHVIAWSTPTNHSRDFTTSYVEEEMQGTTPIFVTRGPPTLEDEARAIRNCVSWPAAEGVYVPYRVSVEDHEFSQTTFIPLYVESSRDGTNYEKNLFAVPYSFYSAESPFEGNPHKLACMDNVGCWFSGLNAETTLTLNSRIIVEVAPINNTSLLSYNPTYSPADPLACTMYREALKSLPPAVTYAENGSAEFWSKTLSVISKVATPIGVMLGQPGIGAGVSTVAAAASKALERKIVKKAEKKINEKVTNANKKLNNKAKVIDKKINAMPKRGKK